MHQSGVPIGILAALVLAGCASKPRLTPALPETVAQQQIATAPSEPARPPAQPSGVQPGSQEDLAATAGDRVYFAVDRFELEAEARDVLRRQAAWLTRYPNVNLLIAGNADERGTREYNIALGARRADAARRYLIASGIATTRIQTVSYGKEKPVDLASTEEAWAKNRNAQTVLVGMVGR